MNVNKFLKLASLIARFASVETNKGELTSMNEIAEGVEVYVKDENDEFIAAPDDVYETETQLITVKDGKVEKIEDKNAESNEAKEVTPDPADEPVNEEFSKKVQLAEQSYSELMQKIHNAIGEDNYVIDAGEGWAVANVYEDDKETAYRYTYSLDAEGNVILGARVEVHPRYVTDEEAESLQFADENPDETTPAEDERDKKIAELESTIAEKDAEIEKLNARIAELEDESRQPVADPVKMSATVRNAAVSEKEIPALKYFK